MLTLIFSLSILFCSLCSAHPGANFINARVVPVLDIRAPSPEGNGTSTTNASMPSTALIGTAIPYATICPAGLTPLNGSATAQATGNAENLTATATETVGPDDCTTLLLPTTAAICNTVLTGMGQAPIPVTDCEQWVTFSSDVGCGSPTAATTPVETTYFLAPWQTIAAGMFPVEVSVEACQGVLPQQTCMEGMEVWSLTEATRGVIGTTTVSFEGTVNGGAVLVLAKGAFTTSIPGSTPTSVSISTTVTTSSLQVIPSVARNSGDGRTITVTYTTTVAVGGASTIHTTVTVMSTAVATHTATG